PAEPAWRLHIARENPRCIAPSTASMMTTSVRSSIHPTMDSHTILPHIHSQRLQGTTMTETLYARRNAQSTPQTTQCSLNVLVCQRRALTQNRCFSLAGLPHMHSRCSPLGSIRFPRRVKVPLSCLAISSLGLAVICSLG